MLESLQVGLSTGARLSRSYAYNEFGDVTALTADTIIHRFTCDGLARFTASDSASSTVRNKGLAGQEMLGQGDENRLSEVQDSNCLSHFVVLSSRPCTRRDYPPIHQRGWVWRIYASGQICHQ